MNHPTLISRLQVQAGCLAHQIDASGVYLPTYLGSLSKGMCHHILSPELYILEYHRRGGRLPPLLGDDGQGKGVRARAKARRPLCKGGISSPGLDRDPCESLPYDFRLVASSVEDPESRESGPSQETVK